MNNRFRHFRNVRAMKGFSMVELMFACFVLMSAILGSVAMIVIGMARNSGTRMDTTATNVAQTFLEDLAGAPPNTNPVGFTITDCNNIAWPIATAQGGAILDPNTGNVDWTKPAVGGYQANYTVCGTNGLQVSYDVRWNIQYLQVGGATWAKQIVVSARQPLSQQGGPGTGQFFYTPPVTLRTVVGM